MAPPDEADDVLVERLRAGDAAAFSLLVDRYHLSIVRVATTVVGSRAVAEEVAQETWVAVIKGIARFEGRSTLKTWLFHIAMNRARSTLSVERRRAPAGETGPAVDPRRFGEDRTWRRPVEDWTNAIDHRIDAVALAECARRAIEALPDVQRQVVTLRDVEGLSSGEVCALMGISAGNERVLLHRGRERVRSAIEAKEDRR